MSRVETAALRTGSRNPRAFAGPATRSARGQLKKMRSTPWAKMSRHDLRIYGEPPVAGQGRARAHRANAQLYVATGGVVCTAG